MSAIKVITYIAAGFIFLLGCLFALPILSEGGSPWLIAVVFVYIMTSAGLFIYARRQVRQDSYSPLQIICFVIASVLIPLGLFFILAGFGEGLRIGWAVFSLTCILVAFGCLGYTQRSKSSSESQIIEITPADEPIQEQVFSDRPKRWRLSFVAMITSAIGLVICSILVIAIGYLSTATAPFDSDGIALRYPLSWKQVSVEPMASDVEVLLALQNLGRGVFRASSWPMANQTADSFTIAFDEVLEEAQEAQILSKEDISVGGENATRWIYTAPCPGYEERTCKFMSVITENEGNTYLFSYVDDPDPFNKYLPRINKLLKSIEFSAT